MQRVALHYVGILGNNPAHYCWIYDGNVDPDSAQLAWLIRLVNLMDLHLLPCVVLWRVLPTPGPCARDNS